MEESIDIGSDAVVVSGGGLARDDGCVATDDLETSLDVGVTAILICGVPEGDALPVCVGQEIGQSVEAEIRLIGTTAPAVGARTETEARDFDARFSEDSCVHWMVSLSDHNVCQRLVYINPLS